MNALRRWHALLAVCLALWAGGACAQGGAAQDLVLRLDPALSELPLAGKAQMLLDASGRMTLEQVRASPMPQAMGPALAVGYTRAAVWLKLVLEQPHGAPLNDWRLVVDNVQVAQAHAYLIGPDGHLVEQRAGRNVARDEWPTAARVPVFILPAQPGRSELYLRLSGPHTLSGAVRLWSVRAFAEHALAEALALGLFYGAMLVVLLVQLLFWTTRRRRLSGWYVLYSAVLLLSLFTNTGYLQNALDWPGREQFALVGVFLCLAPLAMVRLTVVWLGLAQALPRVAQGVQTLAYGAGAATVVAVLLGDYARGVQTAQALSLLWTVLALGLALYLWRARGSSNAGLYLLVFAFVDAGILARFGRNLGLLPSNWLTDYALYIGVGLHMLAMSAYFLHRFNAVSAALALEQRAREEQRDFVSMVSHEFRTPLAIISTSAQQLAANLAAPAEKVQQRCHNIRQATVRLSRLLDDYLSLDRLDSTQQAVVPRACDFFEVIEEVTADWPLERVKIRIEDLPQSFVCDPDLMRIALRNLLANGIRHSPQSVPVELSARGTEAGGLHLRVHDQGCGIEADELPRLFQKYFRGRAAQAQPGAGLGLYLVKRIVELHGGQIRVHSVVGEGTTFDIDIPHPLSPG